MPGDGTRARTVRCKAGWGIACGSWRGCAHRRSEGIQHPYGPPVVARVLACPSCRRSCRLSCRLSCRCPDRREAAGCTRLGRSRGRTLSDRGQQQDTDARHRVRDLGRRSPTWVEGRSRHPSLASRPARRSPSRRGRRSRPHRARTPIRLAPASQTRQQRTPRRQHCR